MPKLRRKFVFIGILAMAAIALLVTVAIPAMAASNRITRGAPGTAPNTNFATVQGTLSLSLSGTSIIVTPGTAPSVNLTPTAGQTANIIYNSKTGAIQRLMLNRSAQPLLTPKNPPANTGVATVPGVVSVGAGNVITVVPSTNPSVPLILGSNTKVSIVYNKTSGAVQSLMSGRMGVAPPGPRTPPNTNFATVPGTLSLSLSGTSIIVTPGTAPSVNLTPTAGQTANILYNSTTKAVQGIMLNRSGQPLPTPGSPLNNTVASVQGAVSVAGNVITIAPSGTPVIQLTLGSNTKVTIVYDKSSGAVQGLMSNRMGMAPPGPRTPPNTNSANLQGTAAVSANIITVTPGVAPTMPFNVSGTPNATIIYNSASGAIQGLMLNKSGQPLPTPKTPLTGFAIVQATVSTDGKTITVTAPSTTPGLNVPLTAKINIIYNKTSGAVQGLMLGRMGMLPFSPGGLPGQGGIKPNTTGPSGPSAPAVPHRQPGTGRMPMRSAA